MKIKIQETFRSVVLLGLLLLGGCVSANGEIAVDSDTAATSMRGTDVPLMNGGDPQKDRPKIRKAQFRKTVAVTRFENRTTAAGQINLGSGMADQLIHALMESENFVVLERSSLSDMLNEQDFSRSNRAQTSTVAQTGRMVPAQILIQGSITEFQLQESGAGVGVSYKGFSVGGESSLAHIALILKTIDTSTGQILDSIRLEGKAEGKGYKFGVSYMGVGVDAEGFENTALSKVVQKIIDRAVLRIAKNLNRIPFQGKIIKNLNDSFYTNIGSRNNVYAGDMFDVYSPGDELLDPDTGENLGSLKKKVGTVVVSVPKGKYSKVFATTEEVLKEGYILMEKTSLAPRSSEKIKGSIQQLPKS